MLAARTTLPHFSTSSARNLPNSADVIGIGTPPRSVSRALILGSGRPALICLLSLSTISTGVFLGAPTPNQTLASYPGTQSPTVGASLTTAERVDALTAPRRSR